MRDSARKDVIIISSIMLFYFFHYYQQWLDDGTHLFLYGRPTIITLNLTTLIFFEMLDNARDSRSTNHVIRFNCDIYIM